MINLSTDDNMCDRCQENEYTHSLRIGCYCDSCFEWSEEYGFLNDGEDDE